MRLSQSQAQDVADAAATAAMYTLRNERSRAAAQRAAQQTCAVNRVAGAPPACTAIQFGQMVNGNFSQGVTNAAVRVEASRRGTDEVGLFFARLWGNDSFPVGADAVAAARPLELIIVLDITISWNPVDFNNARAAAVQMLDTLSLTAGAQDRIGLVAFNGSYGFEMTPMLSLLDVGAVAAARVQWSNLGLASLAGDPADCPWPARCNAFKYTDGRRNDFEITPGGFYPNMPRNYGGEQNTDYYPGLLMAQQMFSEGNTSAFRAMVVLTDGKPYRVPATSRDARLADGHVETRWRFAEGPVPHTEADIITDTVQQSVDMWDMMRTHTWMISFVKDNADLEDVAQGIGYYERVTDSAALISAFQNIAESLPIVLTE